MRQDSTRPEQYRRLAGVDLQGSLDVMRNGQLMPVSLSMPLMTGDELLTHRDTLAIIRYPEGHDVYLMPDTRVRLGSIFTFFGEIFVRAKGFFQANTEFVSAGVEGTEFWLKVEANNVVKLGVLSGSVNMRSSTGRWSPVRLVSNQVFSVNRNKPPVKEKAPARYLDQIRRQIEGIDRRLEEETEHPSSTPPLPTPLPLTNHWDCFGDEEKCPQGQVCGWNGKSYCCRTPFIAGTGVQCTVDSNCPQGTVCTKTGGRIRGEDDDFECFVPRCD
jgi:hypothetical protein